MPDPTFAILAALIALCVFVFSWIACWLFVATAQWIARRLR